MHNMHCQPLGQRPADPGSLYVATSCRDNLLPVYIPYFLATGSIPALLHCWHKLEFSCHDSVSFEFQCKRNSHLGA